VESTRDINIDIVAGIDDNQIIKVKEMGEAGERGTTAGDLYVRVRVKPHAVFARHGADLIVAKELKLVDLLLGKAIAVPVISGGTTTVEIPAGFNLKEHLRISGQGMPHINSRARGDLLVNFIIKAPKKPGNKERELLEKLEKEQ
jgi:molecular chaperone DnaJ